MSSTRQLQIIRHRHEAITELEDVVAVEEPLEIRVGGPGEDGKQARPVSITMRTPGDDLDLAVGFLFTEGIVRDAAEVVVARPCGPPGSNTVLVQCSGTLDLDRLQRHFYTSSSCGVCGKASLEAVHATGIPTLADGPYLNAARIHGLPDTLRRAQAVFDDTGGLHAAGLCQPDGTLMASREDVGRHNALDKLIGHYVRQGLTDLCGGVLVLSGRASFELVQKALMARIGIVVAVGAPSSLAIELARSRGMTLIGFTRNSSFNAYSGHGRISNSND